MLTFLFAHPDYEEETLAEAAFRKVGVKRIAKLLYQTTTPIDGKDPALDPAPNISWVWPRDVWHNVQTARINSVSDATRILKDHSKLGWRHVTTSSHRRGELIESAFFSASRLETLSQPRARWPTSAKELQRRRSPAPAFTLLSANEIAYSSSVQEEVPGGSWVFAEDRVAPPSRAYLKLWEWGWRTERLPRAGEIALDLGACPGGWTWVLANAGLTVHAYDRAPLADSLQQSLSADAYSRIHFQRADAFQILPDEAPLADWVFCDVIAEPRRTLALIEAWLRSEANLVFTVKFKGETDFAVISRLQALAQCHPGSSVRHLFVNKHEITFWRVERTG